jgi:hypothetical protein
MPVVPVRPIVAIQAWIGVAVAGSATRPAVTTTGSAASYRVFATRSGTVLRYRQGTSTRQQYCRHHDAFEEGHVVSPRRHTHLTPNVVCDTRSVIPPVCTLRLLLSRLRRRRRSDPVDRAGCSSTDQGGGKRRAGIAHPFWTRCFKYRSIIISVAPTLRNFVVQIARPVVDVISYQSGCGFEIEIIAATNQETNDWAVFGVNIRILAQARAGWNGFYVGGP